MLVVLISSKGVCERLEIKKKDKMIIWFLLIFFVYFGKKTKEWPMTHAHFLQPLYFHWKINSLYLWFVKILKKNKKKGIFE